MVSLRWLHGSFVKNIQLDIAGFLAILGEGSVESNLQVSTLSKFVFVPRLLPAPQVFLRPSRKTQLERSDGNVTGVHSGNDKDFVNYIGHVVLDVEDMPEYSVRCVEIIKNGDAKVKAKSKGPLSFLSMVGCAESIAILGVSIHNQDGFAVLAVVLFSLLSTLAGAGNYWTLALPKRRKVKLRNKHKNQAPTINQPPKGDVVIRYPNGSFLVVECEEEVARELYFAPETIYDMIESPWIYRLMSLAGTMMLMVAIVALGNSDNVQQILFASGYMILNAAYWVVAALPARSHWDLDDYTVKKQRFEKPGEGGELIYKRSDTDDDLELDFDENTTEKQKKKVKKLKMEAEETFTDLNPSFTYAMWKAIVATKSIDWVKKNDAAPETPVWNDWLRDALREARRGTVNHATIQGHHGLVKTFTVPDWEPQLHFYKLLEKYNRTSLIEPIKDESSNGVQGNESDKAATSGVEIQNEDIFVPVGPRRQGTNLEA